MMWAIAYLSLVASLVGWLVQEWQRDRTDA